MHPANAEPDDATELLAPAATADVDAGLAPGTQVGAYVIRGKLGEGGMGRVHLAEQLRPVQRKPRRSRPRPQRLDQFQPRLASPDT